MEESLKSNLIGQRKIRLEKLQKIKDLGINPYPANSYRDIEIGEIRRDFSKYKGKNHTVVGRIMAWRTHGKLVFADIKDQTGNIQAIVKKESLDSSKELEYYSSSLLPYYTQRLLNSTPDRFI